MASNQVPSRKRKNKGSGDNTKRKKMHQDLSDVRELGQQLLSSRTYINNLPLLLNFLNPASSSPPEFILESILSLQSFFTPLLPQLPSSSAKPTEDPESVYRTWLRSKFDEFVQFLIQLSVSPTLSEEALREVVVDTLMECVKDGNAGKFHSSTYHKFIHTMVCSNEEADTLLDFLVSKYFKYIDIRYFTYISLEKLIRTLDVNQCSDVRSENADSEKESLTRARSYKLLTLVLLDSCLKSPLLPAYLAASFAKKLSRLALTVPPCGGLVIIALIHNLLQRHPSINCLVHQENDQTAKDDTNIKPGVDHFNKEETDLMKTNAMSNSLWEIDTLRHHYCPPLSRFVLLLENDLTVRSKTTEGTVKDFSSGSYATIFRDEMRRRVKQVPLAFYKAIPTSLFSETDFVGWTFQSEEQK
ncbi:hypothetical protein L1987_56601 [Smallanthus sonchifolius]|uniref:Uncharacterized protein n=1 Tax=Smallanthus sonchifolius TaxID=185202 RepID=A0ACB9EDY3_9ASTR|nr:hypothetical protein L1987_56601 [Smallanthus sonchifolius]